ncbi:unnamed protein product [Paramecium sonneborni]|uniref:Uncharacterized protein n=1 Tax=Paramecium sonneborni TaxID=65129 RepID=A0A8S1MNX1_9CILI|nr:unnamed protein product [Paramecium sonneborni]
MLNKENNLIFLQAIQEKQFEKAYKIGSQILIKNPNEQSIKRFMIFLLYNIYLIYVNYQSEEEEDEDDDEEDFQEQQYEQKSKKTNKKLQMNFMRIDKTQNKFQPKKRQDVKNKEIIIPLKNTKQIQEVRKLKLSQKISIKQQYKLSDAPQIKPAIPQISIQFPTLTRK